MAQQAAGQPSTPNIASILGRVPVRGWIVNLETDEGIEFPFSPTTLERSGAVNYSKMTPFGHSHSYHQYQNTENMKFPLELWVCRTVLASRTGKTGDELVYDIEDMLLFLESLTYPVRTPPGDLGGAPPPCIVHRIGFDSVRARLISFNETVEQQDMRNGSPTLLRVNMQWEEAPLERITMDDHRVTGFYRTYGYDATAADKRTWK